MNFIPYGKQSIDSKDIDAVLSTLKSEFLTTGPKVEEFEKKISDYCGVKYAVAVSNGTAALHLSSLALLNEGDKVLTTPNSFLATSNALLYVGAVPIFIDIGADGNIDLDLCEMYLQQNKSIKAIYGVHFSGNPLDQYKLSKIREVYNITVLEDCAHAIGAEFEGIKSGSCTNSDCSIFSFHPVKHLTTGEGGAITTNSEEIYTKLLTLRNHGMVRNEALLENSEMAFDQKGNINPWYYEMQQLGFNYRITDFQCALGISQLEKLNSFLRRRRSLAQQYDEFLKKIEHVEPLYRYNGNSAYHLYVINVDFSSLAMTKAELFMKMREAQIGLQLHYIPINKQPYYRALGYGDEETPAMDRYYESCLSLPIYYELSDEEQKHVITTLTEILSAGRK